MSELFLHKLGLLDVSVNYQVMNRAFCGGGGDALWDDNVLSQRSRHAKPADAGSFWESC